MRSSCCCPSSPRFAAQGGKVFDQQQDQRGIWTWDPLRPRGQGVRLTVVHPCPYPMQLILPINCRGSIKPTTLRSFGSGRQVRFAHRFAEPAHVPGPMRGRERDRQNTYNSGLVTQGGV
jgi:hypothetical protein